MLSDLCEVAPLTGARVGIHTQSNWLVSEHLALSCTALCSLPLLLISELKRGGIASSSSISVGNMRVWTLKTFAALRMSMNKPGRVESIYMGVTNKFE